jgi:hypothetical protein
MPFLDTARPFLVLQMRLQGSYVFRFRSLGFPFPVNHVSKQLMQSNRRHFSPKYVVT